VVGRDFQLTPWRIHREARLTRVLRLQLQYTQIGLPPTDPSHALIEECSSETLGDISGLRPQLYGIREGLLNTEPVRPRISVKLTPLGLQSQGQVGPNQIDILMTSQRCPGYLPGRFISWTARTASGQATDWTSFVRARAGGDPRQERRS
jgi:hypothetical protein